MYIKKIEICGHLIREIKYSSPIPSHYRVVRDNYDKSDEGIKSDKSLYRTRNNVKNIIDCNVGQYSKFITLTFKEDIKSYSVAIKLFRLFKYRFKRKYGEPLKYVGIMELQEGSERHGMKHSDARLVWHFHLVVFNDLKLDLQDFEKNVWCYGITNTKKLDCSDNIGLYLMKYITKDTIAFNKNAKIILVSQGLKRPTILKYLSDRECTKYKKGDVLFSKTIEYERPMYINKKTGEIVPAKTITSVMTEYKNITPKKL